jgi:malate dehydrogenase (oxaloacetate-decarboxylating)(NADP+)
MASENMKITDEEALLYHSQGQPGKISITPTKPLITQRDLALGYSPGVAVPCIKINEDKNAAYDYTSKGNLVAVVSNGTAVLGLGNLGALASKPVMEGKSILFKRFADIDSIDIEVDSNDADKIVETVRAISVSFGGINLEDIAAPDCFIIEERLKELCDIPVFHDDQHGTAIVTAAGIINAAHITGRAMADLKVVANGAGSAGIACIELLKHMGVKHQNVLLCDRSGIIYEGRNDSSMNQWKSAHAVNTKKRTLAEAMEGADVFLGLSSAGAVTKEMVKSMAKQPIIFAMANPVPEIMPEEVLEVRSDAIIATGRSDYNNQVNNVMGFPYIFRGALDVRAKEINVEMKVACAEALAELARADVPDEVLAAYGRELKYGPEYIIPTPFDPRLITTIPIAVAQAAMESGVARRPIKDFAAYKRELSARLDPAANSMANIFDVVRQNPQRVIFAEGEEEKVIRAAIHWRDNGYGHPILIGRPDRIRNTIRKLGIKHADDLEIVNAAVTTHLDKYIDCLYGKLQRKGFLPRDVERMVKNDRNIFASCMIACGHGDVVITGLTRNYYRALENICRVIDTKPGQFLFGMSMLVSKNRTVFISDTAVQELPNEKELADIAIRTARKVQQMGHDPRVALLSYSNFGNPMKEKSKRIRDAVEILNQRTDIDFEYDGEMSADVALNAELMAMYPFCRLSGPANVLIMPALHSAHISANMLEELGVGTVVGPVLVGLEKPVQIVNMNATVADIINLAAIGCIDAIEEKSLMAEKEAKEKKGSTPKLAAAKSSVSKAVKAKKA